MKDDCKHIFPKLRKDEESKGDSFTDEPVSMMDLLKQMQSKQDESENIHPNMNKEIKEVYDQNDSDWDSFHSDDVINTLCQKDVKTSISNLTPNVIEETDDYERIETNKEEIQRQADRLNRLTEHEFTQHIESTLAPIFTHNLKPIDDEDDDKSEIKPNVKFSILQARGLLNTNDPNRVVVDDDSFKSTFK